MTRRDRAWQLALVAGLLALFAVKVWLPTRGASEVGYVEGFANAMIFGLPQLVWLAAVAAAKNAARFVNALAAVAVFSAIYAVAGFLPGMEYRASGGVSEFQLQFAFMVEVAFSILLFTIGGQDEVPVKRA